MNNKDLKIMIIGSSGVGKTSFVQRYTKGVFSNDYKATVISDFGFKIYNYNEDIYRVGLWDIGGQDKSDSMAKIFAKDCHGCIVITDLSINEKPETILNWKEIINAESKFIDNESIPFILIGSKIDLIEGEEKINIAENRAKEICQKYGFLNYFLTSAKENINVEESMKYLIEYIINKINNFCKSNGLEFGQKRKDSMFLHKEKHFKRKKGISKCC